MSKKTGICYLGSITVSSVSPCTNIEFNVVKPIEDKVPSVNTWLTYNVVLSIFAPNADGAPIIPVANICTDVCFGLEMVTSDTDKDAEDILSRMMTGMIA